MVKYLQYAWSRIQLCEDPTLPGISGLLTSNLHRRAVSLKYKRFTDALFQLLMNWGMNVLSTL